MRPQLTAAAVFAALTALLTAPAQADAAYWRGKTEQGRAATVRTGADGLPSSIRIFWRARCRPGRYLDGTRFVPPLDAAAPTSFADAGTYRKRINDGMRARVRVRVTGQLSADGRRWRGSFRGRARIFRDGRRIDTCRVRGVSWRARLRG